MNKSNFDLDALPVPRVIEELSVEQLLELRKKKLLELNPAYADALQAITDPLLIDMEVGAYREYILRHRINEVAQARLLARATGSDLDHLGDFYGIKRKDAAEDDESYRIRIRGRIKGASTAGSMEQYATKAMEVHPSVINDIAVDSPLGGEVRISVLCHKGYCFKQQKKLKDLGTFKCSDFCPDNKELPMFHTGECPDADVFNEKILNDIAAHVSSNAVKMLTDTVTVVKAQEISVNVKAKIYLQPGTPEQLFKTIEEQLLAEWDKEACLGWDLTPSWINSRLHQTGVHHLELETPAGVVKVLPHQYVRWGKVELTMEGRAY